MLNFQVRRFTYDKLERSLNAYAADGWQIVSVEFVGGRDWAVVASREVIA